MYVEHRHQYTLACSFKFDYRRFLIDSDTVATTVTDFLTSCRKIWGSGPPHEAGGLQA